MYEEDLIRNYSEQIKILSDEISELKKQRRATQQLLMDLDSQIMKAIDLMERNESTNE